MLFTTNAQIKKLNAAYRGKNYATDVLSFSQIEAGPVSSRLTFLGDIVISLQKTKSQSREYGVSFEAELLRLLIHGILHLFGYDHEHVPKREVVKMQRLEDMLFQKNSHAMKNFTSSR